MFLTVLIPGPSDPRHKIDVYLQPLIDDLCTLWNDGIPTFDVSLKQNFLMKAALMWTINDFPAYGMLSSWTTAGRLGCPICMERSKAFTTLNFHKVCYFDCHRQFLPLNHAYRRNKKSFKKFGIELHIYHSVLSHKKKKIFLVMVLNIIGRNKVYFGCYHIGKPSFWVITLMSCTQK